MKEDCDCTRKRLKAGYAETDITPAIPIETIHAQVPAYDIAQKIAQEAGENCSIDGREWLEEIKRLNSGGVEQQEEHVEVQYFKIGQRNL